MGAYTPIRDKESCQCLCAFFVRRFTKCAIIMKANSDDVGLSFALEARKMHGNDVLETRHS
jgi:hypothetical protein